MPLPQTQYLAMTDPTARSARAATQHLRMGQAAEMLGVGVDTLRRWESAGRLGVERSTGGQRLVPISEVVRLLESRRRANPDPRASTQSARNRFSGVITRIEADRVAAVVEVLAGANLAAQVAEPISLTRLLSQTRSRE